MRQWQHWKRKPGKFTAAGRQQTQTPAPDSPEAGVVTNQSNVPRARLELACLAAPAPQAGVSTSFTTWASKRLLRSKQGRACPEVRLLCGRRGRGSCRDGGRRRGGDGLVGGCGGRGSSGRAGIRGGGDGGLRIGLGVRLGGFRLAGLGLRLRVLRIGLALAG